MFEKIIFYLFIFLTLKIIFKIFMQINVSNNTDDTCKCGKNKHLLKHEYFS